jgi:hypothetical protein
MSFSPDTKRVGILISANLPGIISTAFSLTDV